MSGGEVLLDESALDNQWLSLPVHRKRKLMSVVKSEDELKDRANLCTIPSELIQNIVQYFSFDPMSFFTLKATCKRMNGFVGDDFGSMADKSQMDIWVHRLIFRCRKNANLNLKIQLRRVFDEKCRYILFQGRGGKVDKYTGIVMADDGRIMYCGYIWDPEPERFYSNTFTSCGPSICYVDEMRKRDPNYKNDCKELKKAWKEGTSELKLIPSRERKTLYSNMGWDEGPQRKRQFV